MLLKQLLIFFAFVSCSQIKTEKDFLKQDELMSKVERLISVIIKTYIPNNEMITVYYDGQWQNNEKHDKLIPDEIFGPKLIPQYREWKIKSYFEKDEVPVVVYGKLYGGMNGNEMNKEIHENLIMYYNYSRYTERRDKDVVYTFEIRKKIIVFLSDISGEELQNESFSAYSFLTKLLYKSRDIIFILKSEIENKMLVYDLEADENCLWIPELNIIDSWDFKTERFEIGTDLFARSKLGVCEYPLISYAGYVDSECVISDSKIGDEDLSCPKGACFEVLQTIFNEAFSINKSVCKRSLEPHDVYTGFVNDGPVDVILQKGASEYHEFQNYDVSNFFGFETLSAVVINETRGEPDAKILQLDIYVVIGFFLIGLLLLLASKLVCKYLLRLETFDSSLFVTLTWSTFIGVSAPNQPRGTTRIAFMAFVVFSFFALALYSQYIFLELTAQSQNDERTVDELDKARYFHMSEHMFSSDFIENDEKQNYGWSSRNIYAVVNENILKSLRFDISYTILPEKIIRPQFLYVHKSIPVEFVNRVILRMSQAAFYDKWKKQYQHQLEMKYETDDDEDEIEDEEFDDDDDDDDDDEDIEDTEYEYDFQPIYLSDLYGPIIVIYSLFALSVVVLIVEIVIGKYRK